MTLKEINERNYAATVRRGYISTDTSINEFLNKIMEEFKELSEELFMSGKYLSTKEKENASLEMADIVLVVMAMARHFHINIETALIAKTLYNEQRTD